MAERRKPEPPLIDNSPGRLVEPLDISETPAEHDVEQAESDLSDGAGKSDNQNGNNKGRKPPSERETET